MNLKEFTKLVENITEIKTTCESGDYRYSRSKPAAIPPSIFSEQYRTGGASGGNCWGDDAHEVYFGEDKPDFEALDSVLMQFCPNISHLQYKRLCKLAEIKLHTWTNYEYYGNRDDYAVEYIEVENLFKALKELDLV
jgi:hypothetical protein